MTKTPKLTYIDATDPLLKKGVMTALEIATGRLKLQRLYRQAIQNCDCFGYSFWDSALSCLKIEVDYNDDKLRSVPDEGPLVLVANHPFGVIDGLIACRIAETIRTDFKVVINNALCAEKRIAKYVLPIDFRDTEEARKINIQSRKESLEVLERGGAILIFPAGGVATSDSFFGPVTDLEWRSFVTKLIQKTRATVIPMFFHGQNSRLFQIVSQFSYTLRLALLLHEVRNKMGRTIEVKIGDPIAYQELPDLSRNELTFFLRYQTHLLGQT